MGQVGRKTLLFCTLFFFNHLEAKLFHKHLTKVYYFTYYSQLEVAAFLVPQVIFNRAT